MAEFAEGVITVDTKLAKTTEPNGTMIEFIADENIFKHYKYRPEYVENQLWNYAYLNAGLKLNYNGKTLVSKNGLRDLLERKTDVENLLYPIIHIQAEDIEVALSHNSQYGEEYYSFVNGQNTTQGGTHLAAFREAIVKTFRDFFKKEFDTRDVQTSVVAAIASK